MRPYSIDLRERVLGAYRRGEGSIEDLADRFEIAPRSIRNWLKLMRTTGSVVPRRHGGGARLRLTLRRLRVLWRLHGRSVKRQERRDLTRKTSTRQS
jgi:transposase